MDTKITKLANGLRIVTVERPQAEMVTLGIWVNTGSANETVDNNGISHLVEHMVFKGTKSRTTQQISEDIENVGGQINAYTSREMTVFYVRMLKEDIELGVDVLAELITSPQFPHDEMEKEKEVIIQEILQTNDDPGDIVFDYFQSSAFAQQALGMSILGGEDKVRSYMPADLYRYMQQNYTAGNIVFAATGDFSHQKLVDMVQKRLGNIAESKNVLKDKQQYTGGFCCKQRDTEQTHVILGFEGVDYYSDDYYPAAILSSVLGGGMSSRLYQEIREKRGLVYSVYSFSDSYSATGVFGIYAGLSAEETHRYLPVVFNELHRIVREPVQDIELNRIKAQFKSGMLTALESSFSTTELAARQLLVHQRIIPLEETIEKINRVSKEDIARVARKIFSSPLTYTILGNIKDYPSYDEIKRHMTL